MVDENIVRELHDKHNFVIVPETRDHPKFGVSLDRYFCGSSFDDCVKGASGVGCFVPSLAFGVEFYRLLRSDGHLYLGDGSVMSDSRRSSVVEDIFSMSDLYRAEFFDTRFGNGNITYSKFDSSGNLVSVTEPLDGDCLINSKAINLDHWLNNATPQGLPPSNNPDGSLYYWSPMNGAVAGFSAGSSCVYLSCVRVPRSSRSGLGVHVAKVLDK